MDIGLLHYEHPWDPVSDYVPHEIKVFVCRDKNGQGCLRVWQPCNVLLDRMTHEYLSGWMRFGLRDRLCPACDPELAKKYQKEKMLMLQRGRNRRKQRQTIRKLSNGVMKG